MDAETASLCRKKLRKKKREEREEGRETDRDETDGRWKYE